MLDCLVNGPLGWSFVTTGFGVCVSEREKKRTMKDFFNRSCRIFLTPIK